MLLSFFSTTLFLLFTFPGLQALPTPRTLDRHITSVEDLEALKAHLSTFSPKEGRQVLKDHLSARFTQFKFKAPLCIEALEDPEWQYFNCVATKMDRRGKGVMAIKAAKTCAASQFLQWINACISTRELPSGMTESGTKKTHEEWVMAEKEILKVYLEAIFPDAFSGLSIQKIPKYFIGSLEKARRSSGKYTPPKKSISFGSLFGKPSS